MDDTFKPCSAQATVLSVLSNRVLYSPKRILKAQDSGDSFHYPVLFLVFMSIYVELSFECTYIIPIESLRTCIHSRRCRLGKGFFRQTRQIFAGIRCVLQENLTQDGGKRPVQTAFEVVNTGSKLFGMVTTGRPFSLVCHWKGVFLCTKLRSSGFKRRIRVKGGLPHTQTVNQADPL